MCCVLNFAEDNVTMAIGVLPSTANTMHIARCLLDENLSIRPFKIKVSTDRFDGEPVKGPVEKLLDDCEPRQQCAMPVSNMSNMLNKALIINRSLVATVIERSHGQREICCTFCEQHCIEYSMVTILVSHY